MSFTMSVNGVQQFNAMLAELRKTAPELFVETCNEQAKRTQQSIKAAAPRGPTGNLKKNIKRLRAKTDRGKEKAVVYIDTRRRRGSAPHALSVIFGTSPRFNKGGVVMTPAGPRVVKRFENPRFTGAMRPAPFFRQKVEQAMPEFVGKVTNAAREMVRERTRRRR